MEMKMQMWTYGVAIMLAAGTIGTAHAQDSATLMHVHGLSYSADGKRLMIPSHHGLAIYENGKWSKAPGPQHDYMGFSADSKDGINRGPSAAGRGPGDSLRPPAWRRGRQTREQPARPGRERLPPAPAHLKRK